MAAGAVSAGAALGRLGGLGSNGATRVAGEVGDGDELGLGRGADRCARRGRGDGDGGPRGDDRADGGGNDDNWEACGRDGGSGGDGGPDRGCRPGGGGWDVGRGCLADGAGGPGAVPVGYGVAQALAHRDGLVSVGVQRGEDVVSEVVDDLRLDVVLDLQVLVLGRIRRPHGLVPDVLAVLDVLWRVVEIASCVEVKVDGMVAKVCQDGLAVLPADRIGGP